MLRQVVLGVANRRAVRRLATGGAGRRVALRFVAGEGLEDAMRVVRRLNADGFAVSLDCLGENVSDPAMAADAKKTYLASLDRIAADGSRASVSVKLTQMGLDVDAALARENTEALVARAAEAGTSVTLDMEDHRYTDRTIEMCVALAQAYPGAVGLALQCYLHRTAEDLDRVVAAGAHVRLCKGAYKEPRAIAFHSRSDVSDSYRRLAERLLASPSYAMIATHDDSLIDHAIAVIEKTGRAPGTFEFQMLYGVRRELQRDLVRRGYPLRVYVPFGSQWYPYLMRRIAERPANVRFFVEAIARG